MRPNNNLNPAIIELIAKDLEKVERLIKNEEQHLETLKLELVVSEENLIILRSKKSTYETILKTGDATYAEPFLYESPKEFKVRE